MNYLKNFEIYMRTDKNASPATVSGYVTDIRNFLNFTDTPEDVADITPANIRSFVAHLTDIGRKRSSINRVICSLRSFFDYLHSVEEVIEQNPAHSIKTGRKEESLPKYIPEQDVQSILKAAQNSGTKEQLLIELLYGSGGRVSEVVSLKVEDIDFDDSFISLFGKGSKERINPIHESCIDLVKKHMSETGITSGYLFPHRTDPNRHMTREAAGKIVKRLAEQAGLDSSKISPHVFRHSFATHLLENGCDMAQVQELLGHEDISTTRIYARITKSNKRSNYVKYHPLASNSV